ncbi:glycosyltransferase [Pedobacter sp. SD-b]|uniref:Glycosyltransferase n=1 Tax=Pedobacter segetis TaxID=2793069 RepID=A0ABS1BIN1_9SPHI|nr:glycosyltransferase [Pedobacter segetis]MBK0382059.1 glycosyltransferase [Pedobacter segetis]
MKRNKVILVHPGLQYTYRIASALSKSKLFDKVSLYTWFTLSEDSFLSRFPAFKKRAKKIDPKVEIYNFPFFELLLVLYLKVLNVLKINKGHNPRYKMQILFGWFLLPAIYLNRKKSLLVLSETAAWPITFYAKKWHIPVVMDFPSISHEVAMDLGIKETAYGIKLKTKERNCIDYAFNCSAFAADTYKSKTSAKKHFPLWLAAEDKILHVNNKGSNINSINICCLANTEKRKGIDLLIKAFSKIELKEKKLYLIGKISNKWVAEFCIDHHLGDSNIILTGPLMQKDIAAFLLKNRVHLHVLASRFDSFGMVVPETMMLGIPNILSPFVGAAEMLENGVDGFVMDQLNEDALLNCINKFIGLTEAERLTLKNSVLEKAKEMTWENYDLRVKAVFEEILSSIPLKSTSDSDAINVI